MIKFGRRILAILLVIISIFSIVLVPVNATELTGANKRINTYINMAKGEEITDTDAKGLTQDELRFLGVYISNFFVPFKTELGVSGESKDSVLEQNKEQMVKALQTKLSFSDDLASGLVNELLGLSRSAVSKNVDQMKYFVKDGDSYIQLPGIIVNYYNFMEFALGRSDILMQTLEIEVHSGTYSDPSNKFYENSSSDLSLSQEELKILYEFQTNTYDKVYMGYGSGSSATIVADFYVASKARFTPFQIAFMKCLEATDMDLGWGTSLLDFTISEMNDDPQEALKTVRTKFNSDQILGSTIVGEKVAVDCFGNIVVVGTNHQFVAVPGAVNPFTWVKVDSTGKDVGKAGDYYQIINALSMSQNDNGLLQTAITAAPAAPAASPGPAASPAPSSSKVMNANLSEFYNSLPAPEEGGYKFKAVYGSSLDKLSNGVLWMTDATTRDYFGLDYDSSKDDGYTSAIQHFLNTRPDDWSMQLDWGNFSKLWEKEYKLFYVAGQGSYSTNVGCLDNLVFIDNLGVFEGQEEFNALNVASYVGADGESEGTSTLGDYSVFSNHFADVESGKIFIPDSFSEQALASVYSTYLFAGLYDESNKADSIGKLGYRMAIDTLPEMPKSALKLSGDLLDSGVEAIKNWVYYLLHPTQGFQYVTVLITNKVNHILLKWHADMTGTNGVGAISGTTTYRGNTGYVSMPDLSEIEWTSSLIDFYNNSIPFLIVIMIVIMLFAFITGILKLQHSILGVVIFSAFLLMPVGMINATVDISNRVSQSVYSNKFTYWALVQQESYASAIDQAANKAGSDGTSTYDNYLRTLLAENTAVYANQGGESILLKWQAPRKFKAVGLSQKDASMMSGLTQGGKKMLLGAINGAYSGQSFTDNDTDTYLYRSYIDTGNISRYTYNGIKNKTREATSYAGGSTNPLTINTTNWPNEDLRDAVRNQMATNFSQYRAAGFTGSNGDGSNELDTTFYVTVPIASSVVGDMLKKYDKIEEISEIETSSNGILETSKIGLNPDLFSFSIPMFNNKDYTLAGDEGFKNFCATLGISDSDVRGLELKSAMQSSSVYYTEGDMTSLAAFALYTESPFYYFSWKLYNDGLDPASALTKGHYKDVILKDNYFYNDNGGLNDFMDMKSLFTYIIPYLKQCNDMVRKWDNVYGCFLYEGVPTEEGHWAEVQDNPDLIQKYWHNINVARLYSIYSPWVDILYDCSYSKPTQLKVFDNLETIEDPLSPFSYPEDRPMIFSEAEMVYMGLGEADLTAAERLILKTNEDMQERLYDLLNYYNFSDVTMATAAGMNCTFAFNTAFTETGLFRDNKILYPQSFDLPSFSYDAFLRLIIANNTGEDLLDTSASGGTSTGDSTGDFYERVVNKSSTTTVIVMLVLDVLSIYVIPMLRIFFVVAIFLASIFIILASAMRIESNVKFVTKVVGQFVIPLVQFLLTTIAFSLIISLFMGVGNNAVTQTARNSIQMGDPVMAMLLMIVINVACVILYWKIIANVLRGIKSDFRNVRAFTSSALSGVGTMVAAGAGAVVGGMAASFRSGGSSAGVSGEGSSGGSSSGSGSESASGSTSARANARASSGIDNVNESSLNTNTTTSSTTTQYVQGGSAEYDNSSDYSSYNNYRAPNQPLGVGERKDMDSKERQEFAQKQLESLDSRVDSGAEKIETGESNSSNSNSNNPNTGRNWATSRTENQNQSPRRRSPSSYQDLNNNNRNQQVSNNQQIRGNNQAYNNGNNGYSSNPENSGNRGYSGYDGAPRQRVLNSSNTQRYTPTQSTIPSNGSQQMSGVNQRVVENFKVDTSGQVSRRSREERADVRERLNRTPQQPSSTPRNSGTYQPQQSARQGNDDPNRGLNRSKNKDRY